MKLFLLWLLALPMIAATQNKKSTVITLDVDRLYQKYKDYETVTIHTADGDLTANVKCFLNEKGKPYSVILYGYCGGNVSVEKLSRTLESQKTKSGYGFTGYSSVSFEGESVLASLYEKNTQYAKYGIKRSQDRYVKLFDGTEIKPDKYPVSDFFYFEVGDVRRRNTGNQETFTF
jgi:hypothetical protein